MSYIDGAAFYTKNTVPHKEFKFSGGEGAEFWDDKGNKVIDLSSQTVNLLFGQVHKTITQAVINQLNRFTFVDEDFYSQIHVDGISNIYNLLPKELRAINLRMNDGSSAVECAVKQARYATGRPGVLTCEGIYLGQNTQTIGLRGWGQKRDKILIGSREEVIFCPLPYSFTNDEENRNIEKFVNIIEEYIKTYQDRLACVLLDPVMLSYGICAAPALKYYILSANEACKKYNVPLVLDESQSFGWVPKETLSSLWELDVDALILAKGVAGGFPLSICASKPYFDNLERGDADYTHGGHPLSIAALNATCSLIENERGNLIEISEFLEKSLLERTAIRHGIITHGVGLIRAIQIRYFSEKSQNEEAVSLIAQKALLKGVYVRKYGITLGIKPPRVITKEQIIKSLDILFEVIDEVLITLQKN